MRSPNAPVVAHLLIHIRERSHVRSCMHLCMHAGDHKRGGVELARRTVLRRPLAQASHDARAGTNLRASVAPQLHVASSYASWRITIQTLTAVMHMRCIGMESHVHA